MQGRGIKRAGWKLAATAALCLVGAGCAALDDGEAKGEAISLTFEASETTTTQPVDGGESGTAAGETSTTAADSSSSTTGVEGLPEADPAVTEPPEVEPPEVVIGDDAALDRSFHRVVDVPLSDTLNVRAGPGIDKGVVEELNPGEPVLLSGATATLATGTIWFETVDVSTLVPRGWAHGGFLDPVVDPIVTGLDGSPAVPVGQQGGNGNGAISPPSSLASGCNAVQVRIDWVAGLGPGGSGTSHVVLGSEPPSGSWDGTLSNTVWSAGPETDRFLIEPGEAVIVTLPAARTYYVMALGPGNSEPIVDAVTNQPLVNAQGRIDSAAHHTVDAVAASGC